MTSSGCGESAKWASSSASVLTSPSRRRSQPVATGLSTPTRLPCPLNHAAIAAAMTVLPTPVSVPVTNKPGIRTGRSTVGFYEGCRLQLQRRHLGPYRVHDLLEILQPHRQWRHQHDHVAERAQDDTMPADAGANGGADAEAGVERLPGALFHHQYDAPHETGSPP